MRSASTAIGILTAIVLAGFPLVAGAQDVLPPTRVAGADAQAGAKPAMEPTAPTAARQDEPAARRGRWGASAGVIHFGGTATYDYRNSVTTFAGASGPYTGAVIEIDHVGPGFMAAAGYRGPFQSGGRVGFGLATEFGGGGGHADDKQVIGTSPNGTKVTFSTEKGGIVDLVFFGGSGHVSYNLARFVSIMAGAKVTSLRVKSGFGSYRGPASPAGQVNYLANQGDRAPRFWLTSVTPYVGAEVFAGDHMSLDLSASFQSGTSEHLADSPWSLTFKRRGVWLSAALRIFH